MLNKPLSVCCLLTTVCTSLLAQQPEAKPAPAAPPTAQSPAAQGSKDALQVAFIDAAGNGRVAISDAANRVLALDAAGRTKFMETLRAIAAVAPKPGAAEPAKPAPTVAKPAEGTPPAATPPAVKPPEFADDIKQLMASVVSGTPEASKAALAKLAENKETGTAALQRLDERGKAIFERCLLSTFRKKIPTNAVYAGQYNELASFQPEAGQILLRWALDAPKDAPNAESFPSACVRALRDVVPADQATDAMRETLRKIAAKGESSGKNDLFVGAVCALHQYGDPSIFDKIKEGMSKRAASESEQDKLSATNMLAELHYQLRDYNEAANHFKSLVGLIEASGQTQGLPTVLYNTACVLSLGKNLDESFQYLERALQADKTKSLSRAMLDEDQDLKNLREDPRFGKILESFGKPASAGK
jgi:tetratricopeptide (TPR) repeat protein